MRFKMAHNDFNVTNLEKSMRFYETALGLRESGRIEGPDGAFTIVYLGDGATPHRLALTWIRGGKERYDLGDNEFHLAFTVDDYEKARELHAGMGCICYENDAMGIYFIEDPDGYWLEVLPEKHMEGK